MTKERLHSETLTHRSYRLNLCNFVDAFTVEVVYLVSLV